jgi:hypothetical protein
MIVLSAGMQKAGSAWFFNMTNDMLVSCGSADCRTIRERYRLGRLMTAANCNIDSPTFLRMAWIGLPALFGETYVVKTHEAPTSSVRRMLRRGSLKATYIYRDPRDVAVSLFEHGRRIREQGIQSNTGFDRLETLEDAIHFANMKIAIWQEWRACQGVLMMRYEDLVADPLSSCQRVAEHLSLSLSEQDLQQVIQRYDAKRAAQGKAPHPLHFNKGVSGRWKQELSNDQQELCIVHFGDLLPEMGYGL